MVLLANLFITKKIDTVEKIRHYASDIATYIPYVDKLIIYNMTGTNLIDFYKYISRYHNIECTDCEDLGEVYNYERAMKQAHKMNADYTIILEQDYYYEEGSFLGLKRMILDWKEDTLPAVLSAYPKFTCEMFSKQDEELRIVKGVHLVGVFLNVVDYFDNGGFEELYYETTFDYDYCITLRLNGKKIYVANNFVIRNRNFKILNKKILTFQVSGYEKSPTVWYYETRNRYYLWEKFKNLDPDYVALDQKLFKNEVKEMNLCDPMKRYKREIIEDARRDGILKIMGKHTVK